MKSQIVLLSAGLGSRLGGLTSVLPKCMMPVRGAPLLEYWLTAVRQLKDPHVYINCHYRSEDVKEALHSVAGLSYISILDEPTLLGTAGTIRELAPELVSEDVIVAHADNLTDLNLASLLERHQRHRPSHCWVTMVTFNARRPELCGSVSTDEFGVVTEFKEKSPFYTTTVSNAAVYVFNRQAVKFIAESRATDISLDIIPELIGRIWTYHHGGVHRDIGTPEELLLSQFDGVAWSPVFSKEWHAGFNVHPIHALIRECAELAFLNR